MPDKNASQQSDDSKNSNDRVVESGYELPSLNELPPLADSVTDQTDDFKRSTNQVDQDQLELPTMYNSTEEAITDRYDPNSRRLGITFSILSLVMIIAASVYIVIILQANQFQPTSFNRSEIISLLLLLSVDIIFIQLLMKKEWARRTVLFSLHFLKIYPLNWIVGNLLIRKLKSKNFGK